MPITGSPEYGDVLEDVFVQKVVSVGATATKLVVASSADPDREIVRIYNDSNSIVYIGPSTVTSSGTNKGEPLYKKQWIELPFGPDLEVYGIVASGTADVIVTEAG
jgi:hypothetical protein